METEQTVTMRRQQCDLKIKGQQQGLTYAETSMARRRRRRKKTSTHQENQKHGCDRGITITKKGASEGHLHLNIVFFTGSTPVNISP